MRNYLADQTLSTGRTYAVEFDFGHPLDASQRDVALRWAVEPGASPVVSRRAGGLAAPAPVDMALWHVDEWGHVLLVAGSERALDADEYALLNRWARSRVRDAALAMDQVPAA